MYRIAMEEVKKRGINIRFINIMTKKKKSTKNRGIMISVNLIKNISLSILNKGSIITKKKLPEKSKVQSQ